MTSPHGRTKKLNLQLWHGQVFVGDLLDVFVHQGTWFAASFRQAVNPNGEEEKRICDFINLSEHWHQRLKRGMDPSPTEFDQFLAALPNWRVRSFDGKEMAIDVPFFMEGEASWIRPDSGDPNPEATAWREWCSLAGHNPKDV